MPRPVSDVRQRILEDAIKTYVSEGSPALRVQEVANSVGASVATIYKYFNSREKLVDAVIVELFRRVTQQARDITEKHRKNLFSSKSSRPFIDQYLELSQKPEMAKIRKMRMRLLGDATTRPKVFKEISQIYHDDRVADAQALELLMKQGRINASVDPVALSYLISGTIFSQIAFENGPRAQEIIQPFKALTTEAFGRLLDPH